MSVKLNGSFWRFRVLGVDYLSEHGCLLSWGTQGVGMYGVILLNRMINVVLVQFFPFSQNATEDEHFLVSVFHFLHGE